MKRTNQELQELKQQWLNDPIWDIEITEGFEAHHDELLEYRNVQQALWQQEALKRLEKQATRIGTKNLNLAAYILELEFKIEEALSKIDEILGET